MSNPSGSPERSSSLRTFLLADIRGYTAYTAEHGDDAAAHLSELFLSLCREVVASHGGVVFGSAGDQALAAFLSARAALQAAVALRQRLADEQASFPQLPLAAGIGLDAGEAIQVGDDYRGGAINLAARLCSIAGGGEIFASEGVIHLARATEGIAFTNRGEVTLKGLANPVRVFQIAAEGKLPANLPPLQAAFVTPPTNLPDEPTPFIGREQEIDQVARLFRDPHVRMVTLIGPGGTGKTRLGLQVGTILLPEFRDGVFLVNLAPLSDPGVVPSAIAEVMGVREEAGQEILSTLGDALAERDLLLILDNYEHLLDASWLVAHMLDVCRGLHVLVTSRIPLHLEREHEYPVPPLAVPDPQHLPDLESLSRYEAIALFVQRVRAVKPDFALSAENAPALVEICWRLDGLPLAIELAAARIKLFPPPALLQRLSSRLTLLTGGAKDRPTRQQALRNTIDWSYNLLSDGEQRLFARLSVFAGGCGFEAAEAVCNSQGDVDLLGGMSSLVDKSLVRQEGTEEARFSMLETIREYAREKLQERGVTEATHAAHAGYFLRLADEAETGLTSADQHLWMQRLTTEYENLRAALGWFAAIPEGAQSGLRLAGALSLFWVVRGLYSDGLHWLERLLALAEDTDTVARARAVWGAGYLYTVVGDQERAQAVAEHSLTLARRIGHTSLIARSLGILAILAFFHNDYTRARELFEESAEMARQAKDDWCLADSLGTLNSIYPFLGEFARARTTGMEALQLARRRDDRQGIRMALFGLALMDARLGNLAAARKSGEEGLAICREIDDPFFTSYFLWILATVSGAAGNRELARVQAGESLLVARKVGAPLLIVCALEVSVAAARSDGQDTPAEALLDEAEEIGRSGMVPYSYLAAVLRAHGELVADRGDFAQAVTHLDESIALSRQVGDVWSVERSLVCLADVARRRQEPEWAKALAREALAAQVQLEDRLGMVQSLERLGALAGDEGRVERAANLLSAASELRRVLGAAPGPAPDGAQVQQPMGLEDAISYALQESE